MVVSACRQRSTPALRLGLAPPQTEATESVGPVQNAGRRPGYVGRQPGNVLDAYDKPISSLDVDVEVRAL